MKANSLEELVTNSNILGDLRNHTDWHTRLVKFAQLVADWQKSQMLKDAVEVRVQTSPLNGPLGISAYCCNFPSEHPFYRCKLGDKVRIIIVKEDFK